MPDNRRSPLAQIIISRILQAIPLLFLLSVASFALIRMLPGDPVEAMLGESPRNIDPQQLAFLRHEMGLDEPIPVQYGHWLGGWIGKGELGRSYQDGRPVLTVIAERMPATLLLVFISMTLSFSLGTAWGLMLAWLRLTDRLRWLEESLVAGSLALYSIPAFLVGIVTISVLTGVCALHSIPVFCALNLDGQSALQALIPLALIPALALGLPRAAKVALFIRTLALDEISRNYVTMALAKGSSYSRVMTVHVLRNCLLPVVNLLALSLPALIGGSVLIETIFGWPGMGRLAVEATFGRNYPVSTCLVLIYGTMVVLSNLLADVLSVFIDPRLKDGLSGPGIALKQGQM
ncbi:MAG: ABC transporter permease [Candidatus Obscuribacterales bacterium]